MLLLDQTGPYNTPALPEKRKAFFSATVPVFIRSQNSRFCPGEALHVRRSTVLTMLTSWTRAAIGSGT